MSITIIENKERVIVVEVQPGKYFVIEGIDFAGKTTQEGLLRDDLRGAGRETVVVVEPEGTPIGAMLRPIILDSSLKRSPITNVELFTACRREVADQVIRPALVEGKDVVATRCWMTTLVYQGFGEGVDPGIIVSRSREALGPLFMPDLAIIIDIPVEESRRRMENTPGRGKDIFERKDLDFFNRIREGYLLVADAYNLPVIDGTKPIEAVRQDIRIQLGKVAINL